MFIQDNQLIFPATNYQFIFDLSAQNKLIGLAFLLITSVTNLYAISQGKKPEVLFGTLYCFASLGCLFANDFISMVIFLEFMNILACMLIFYSEHPFSRNNIKFVSQYFLTHIFSSGLILIGISLLISQGRDNRLTSLTELVNDYSLGAIFILAGLLINSGIVFFNGWIVNCYPSASSIALVYLLSFTTKVTIIIMLKLFQGLEVIKLFGGLMIIYGTIFALIEQNLKRLLCYITIAHLGFILMVISSSSPNIKYLTTSFVFIHILYNGLFVLCFAFIYDLWEIKNYNELKIALPIKYPILFSSYLISILISTNLMPIISSDIKTAMVKTLNDDISECILIFFKMGIYTVLFELFLEQKITPVRIQKLKFITSCSFFIMLMITLISCTLLPQILIIIWPNYPTQILTEPSSNLFEQLVFVGISIILALTFRKIPKISSRQINLDLFQLHYMIRYCKRSLGLLHGSSLRGDYEIIDVAIWSNKLKKIAAASLATARNDDEKPSHAINPTIARSDGALQFFQLVRNRLPRRLFHNLLAMTSQSSSLFIVMTLLIVLIISFISTDIFF